MIQGVFVIYDLKSKTTASQIMLAPSDAVIIGSELKDGEIFRELLH